MRNVYCVSTIQGRKPISAFQRDGHEIYKGEGPVMKIKTFLYFSSLWKTSIHISYLQGNLMLGQTPPFVWTLSYCLLLPTSLLLGDSVLKDDIWYYINISGIRLPSCACSKYLQIANPQIAEFNDNRMVPTCIRAYFNGLCKYVFNFRSKIIEFGVHLTYMHAA